MEQNKKKGGAGRVILIILIVLVVLGAAGYFALRAFVCRLFRSQGFRSKQDRKYGSP